MSKYGEVFKAISPNFKEVMSDLISNDPLNSKSHDEGNYDVDRMDYLLRDALYSGEKLENYTHEQYERKYAKIDENGNIIKNTDNSVIIVDESSKESKIPIDVYEQSSLKAIEQFLERRVQAYKNMYFSGKTQVSDYLVGKFVDYAISHEDSANELKIFMEHLKERGVDTDLQEFLSWEDIKFYNNCIKVGENSKNKYIRDFAGMIIPDLKALMNVTYSHLDLKNKRDNLNEDDEKFIQKIKYLIENDSDLSKMLKDENYYDRNCLICTNNEKIEQIRKKFGDNVMFKEITVKGYKSTIPVYIKDKNGRVFMLNEHPEKSCDWENRKETVRVAFVAIPILKMRGLNDKEINEIKAVFQGQEDPNIIKNSSNKMKKVNMSLVRADTKMEDYFCR